MSMCYFCNQEILILDDGPMQIKYIYFTTDFFYHFDLMYYSWRVSLKKMMKCLFIRYVST